ncbi:hypothetical protein DNTS_015725 [Danionella cerebrum]|uniref:Voltage-dependent T-type calcium channel subunit alpha-1I n=1 Tax=Danionella cerebrum TaxID=2873325 RepID=A0A553QD08_9TELE|nr:hypothetical protein DNTS_015725 [Danionella translucida]
MMDEMGKRCPDTYLSFTTLSPGCCSVTMTTEECPVQLGMSQVGPGLCEDFGLSQVDDIIEEVGPCDDTGSDLSTLVVPFPELAPVVFFCLKQTTCPRNWCIRMVSSPYPLFLVALGSDKLIRTHCE